MPRQPSHERAPPAPHHRVDDEHRPLVGRLAGLLLLTGLAFLSCRTVDPGQEPEPASADTAQQPKPARGGLLDAPLLYEVPDAEAEASVRRIHTPMVRATVNGVATLLIIDSGATDHVFTRRLAESIGVTLVETDPGTDHAGMPVASYTTDARLSVGIEDASFFVDAPIVIEGPPPFERWGIGGFLSPQQLAPDALLLLDLEHQRLKLHTDQADAWDGLVREVGRAVPDRPGQLLPRVMGQGDAARLIIVEGRWSEHGPPVRVMLNSGGREAEATPAQVPDAGAAEEDTGRGVSGASVRGARAEGRRLLLGRGALDISSLVVREQGDAYDVQLGIEPLTGTILAVHPDPAIAVGLWLP